MLSLALVQYFVYWLLFVPPSETQKSPCSNHSVHLCFEKFSKKTLFFTTETMFVPTARYEMYLSSCLRSTLSDLTTKRRNSINIFDYNFIYKLYFLHACYTPNHLIFLYIITLTKLRSSPFLVKFTYSFTFPSSTRLFFSNLWKIR